MVTNLKEDDVQCTTATISWNPVSSTDCDSRLRYIVNVRQLDGDLLTSRITTRVFFFITRLNASTTYNVSVAARNDCGTGSSSIIAITTLDTYNITTPDGKLYST